MFLIDVLYINYKSFNISVNKAIIETKTLFKPQ